MTISTWNNETFFKKLFNDKKINNKTEIDNKNPLFQLLLLLSKKKIFTKKLHRATTKEFRECEVITIKVLNFFFHF